MTNPHRPPPDRNPAAIAVAFTTTVLALWILVWLTTWP